MLYVKFIWFLGYFITIAKNLDSSSRIQYGSGSETLGFKYHFNFCVDWKFHIYRSNTSNILIKFDLLKFIVYML